MIIPPSGVALPVVKTLKDCADYHITFEQFLPQLYSLPQLVWATITDLDGLKTLYVSTNPLVSALGMSIFLAPIFLVVSEINKNYSQVDRFWSLLPTIYHAHYAVWARMVGLPTARVDTIFLCSCVWSARLTFNYWRKGGYQVGSEDYRWEIVKSKVPPAVFFLFNVSFISTIQSILLWSVTIPTYVLMLVSRKTGAERGIADYIFPGALVALVAIEFIADNQQWQFQTAKKEYKGTAKVPQGWKREDLDRGFIQHGLWSYSRHPNFAAEQAFWLTLYQWSCFETGSPYYYGLAAVLSYLFLFQGSTWLTERISAGKYPEYKEHQKRTGMFFPKIW